MKIRNVLCPVDFSRLSEREMDLAVQICRRFEARLVIEHNLDPRPPNYLSVSWMWSEGHEGEQEDRAAGAEWKLKELLDRLPAGRDPKCAFGPNRGPLGLAGQRR